MENIESKTNYIDFLKKYLEDKDKDKAAECLVNIYMKAQNDFKKNLLLGGVLPEPSAFDLKKKIYIFECFKESCNTAINRLKESGENVQDFSKQADNIINTYQIIVNHNKSNEKRCDKNEFLTYNKAKQLQMWCVFIEDQIRLVNANTKKIVKTNGVYTGIESMTPLCIDENEQSKISSGELIENNMELAEEMFKFIFYINRKSIKNFVNISSVDSYPYEVPSFEEIGYLASHRVMVRGAWNLFKYRNWTLKTDKIDNIKYYSFIPQNYKEFKREGASLYRKRYSEFQKSIKTISLWKIFNENLEIVSKKIYSIELEDIFNINSEYIKELMKFYESIIQSNLDFALRFYGENLAKVEIEEGITFKHIFDTINYLYSIANIYMNQAYGKVDVDNKNDYCKFAPIIEKEKLITQLSKALEIDREIALKCIEIFIFKPVFDENQIVLDLFSQPLVYISDEQIIFTPCFIMQMNVERIIDKILGAIDYNFSDKGYNMEKLINNMINESEYIDVNKNRIKFNAYDGKDVEFDFIAVFKNKLIIMEMKCRNTPYSSKEKNDKEGVLDEVVEQIKRRVDIVQHDWDEIKKRASIELMENAPNENDIIKIACFNFFDFTGQTIDGIYITDHSAITKYFNNPIDYAFVTRNNSIEKKPVGSIWNGEKPTIDNLLGFLEMPNMLKGFYDNIKFTYKPIIRIEENDENISVIDYYLEKNPYEEYIKLAIDGDNTNFNKKNSKCDENKSKKSIKKKRKQSKNSRKLQRKK